MQYLQSDSTLCRSVSYKDCNSEGNHFGPDVTVQITNKRSNLNRETMKNKQD